MYRFHPKHFSIQHPVVKFITIIPIIVVILTIWINSMNNRRTVSNFNIEQNVNVPSIEGKSSPDLNPKNLIFPNDSNELNLLDEQQCSYNSQDIEVNMWIKNKKILFTTTKKIPNMNFLILNNCFYKWESNKKYGDRVCQIGEYLSLLENFSKLYLLEMILSIVPKDILPVPQESISQLLNSCSKVNIEDTIFNFPKSVQFKEKKIEQIQTNLDQLE